MTAGAIVLNQPGVYLVDADGNVVTLADGDTIGSAEGLIIAGKDGTAARFMRVAADGTVRVDPTGTTNQPVELRDVQHDQAAAYSVFGLQKVAQESVIGDLRFDRQALVEDWNITRTAGGNYQAEPGGVGVRMFTSAAVGSKIEFESKRRFRYQSGRGSLLKMSIILGDTGVAGNRRRWGLRNDAGDGLFYELDGTTMQFIHQRQGTVVSTTAASAWDVPVTIDANGHLWFIQYPWLGVADPFLLYDNALVHRLAYIGTSQQFSLGDPDMHVFLECENVSNSTAVTLKSGCASVVVEGGSVVSGALESDTQGAVENLRVTNRGTLAVELEDKDTALSVQVYDDSRNELQVRDDIALDVQRLILRELRAIRFQLGHATELRGDEEDDQ